MSDRKEYIKQWRIENAEHIKEYSRQRYINNRDKILMQTKKWKMENKEYILECRKEYYQKNKEKIKEYSKKHNQQYYIKNRIKIINSRNQYYIENRTKMNIYHIQYMINRRKTDLKFALNYKISKVINQSLKGNKNGRHWENLVGYTVNNLIKRLNKTIPQDYTWEDFINGNLHIDHIFPIRLFQFKTPEDEEFKQCWGLENLRLLTKKDNLSKNDSINNPLLLGLLLKEAI